MSQYEKEWYGKAMILMPPATWKEIVCHYMDVKMPITEECWSGEIRWFDNGELANTIVPNSIWCGKYVMVYGGTTPSLTASNLLFEGYVSKIGQEYTGDLKEKSEKYMTLYGFGRRLQENELSKRVPAGNDVEQFNFIADQAISRTIINSKNIYNTVLHTDLKSREGKRTYWDLFTEVAKEADWDFYVDNDICLQAFPRGQYTLENVLITPSFKAKIEYDSSNIINSMEVWGYSGQIIGTDTEYSDGTTNWTGNNVSADTTDKKVGVASIKSTVPNGQTPWMKRSFDPFLDFDRGGKIHFSHMICSADYDSNAGANSIEITMYSDDNNYTMKTIGVTGGKMKRDLTKDNKQYYYYYEWGADVHNNIGFNVFDVEGWTETGIPDWSSITAIKFALKYPINGINCKFWIDDLYFTDIAQLAQGSDTVSIAAYGIKKGATQRDSALKTDDQCQAIVDSMINTYKNPRVIIQDTDTEDSWNYTLGYRGTVSLYGNTVVAEIRELGYTFEGKKLTESVKIAERFVPSPEKAIKDAVYLLRKFNWSVPAFNKYVADSAICDVDTAAVGWNRVVEAFPYMAWTSQNNISMLGESKEGYEYYEGTPVGDGVEIGAGGYLKWIPNMPYESSNDGFTSKGSVVNWIGDVWLRMKIRCGKSAWEGDGYIVGAGDINSTTKNRLALGFFNGTIYFLGTGGGDVWSTINPLDEWYDEEYDMELRYFYNEPTSSIEVYFNQVLANTMTMNTNTIDIAGRMFGVQCANGTKSTIEIKGFRVSYSGD